MVACKDCGLDYQEFGLDAVMNNEQWLSICPEGFNVLLCPNCIAIRASKLKGVICMKIQLETKSLDDYHKEHLELREEFAELAHSQWSGWMEYLFSKGKFNDDGTWTMPEWAVSRWTRQMRTPFSGLSEAEKDSDRTEADKFLEALPM